MTGVAITLVLASAVVHTTWNRFVHARTDRLATMAVSGLAGALLLSPAVLVHPPTSVWRLVLLSGVAEAVYAWLLVSAYAHGSLAVAYPIGRGTAPLLVTVLAWAAAGQRPSAAALAAAVSLAAGLAVLALAGRSAGQARAVTYALATGVSIGVYSVVDAVAVGSTSAAGYLGAALAVQGLLLSAACLLGSARSDVAGGPISAEAGVAHGWSRVGWGVARLRRALRPGVAVGAGVVAAYLLVLLAFQRAPAGRVATLREVSVLLAVAVSSGRRPPAVWAGAFLVVLGAVGAAV